MTLKDWKISRKFGNGGVLWSTRKADRFGNVDEIMVQRSAEYGWEVITDNPRFADRNFKKKSDALSYAGNYRRTHPRRNK